MMSPLPAASLSPFPSEVVSKYNAMPTQYAPGMELTFPIVRPSGPQEAELPEDVLGRRKINYDVVMFHGKRGDGKSTLAVATAKRIRRIWDNLDSKNKIFTNFRVNFADMAHPRIVDQIVQFPDWCHDCLIVIDELASNFPSLRANSREQLMFQTFLQQIRKLHISVLFTTQYPTYVGAASNIQINWYIKPHLYGWHYWHPVRQWVADCIGFDVVDWFGSQTGFPIMHRWPPMPWDAVYHRDLVNVSEIYTEFDTDEVIPPFFAPNRQQVMERYWKPEFDQEQDAADRLEAAKAEARRTLKDIQDLDPTTLEEFYETLKVTLPNKPERLAVLFDMVKKINNRLTLPDFRKELESQGWVVAKIGQSYQVGKR